MKAIEILKYNKNAMIKFINSFDDDCKEDDEYISGNKYIEELNEAIKELEELNNRSCGSCKYKYIDGKYLMCKHLNSIVTPKFYCKAFIVQNTKQKGGIKCLRKYIHI